MVTVANLLDPFVLDFFDILSYLEHILGLSGFVDVLNWPV